jgi:hypothetical protein
MEKLDISELIEDLMQDEDFKESCDDESVNWTLSMMLGDAAGSLKWNNFPTGDQYKFEFEDAYSEKGDRKDEETYYGIFKRKSDDKFFKVWIHDAGFIGPETLTMCDYMEEVRSETKKIKTWDKF